MSQITSGFRAILSHPIVYQSFQSLMGARASNQRFASEYIRPKHGMRVLDIGCGPADILEYLTQVEYWGIDISEAYIAVARERFSKRGNFVCGILTEDDLSSMPTFDLVLGMGVLHHLDDADAIKFFNLAHLALKDGGRLVTIDPCLVAGQNPVARILIKMDRGQNVRTRPEYDLLASCRFETRSVIVRHSAWIPYTHCIMECVA